MHSKGFIIIIVHTLRLITRCVCVYYIPITTIRGLWVNIVAEGMLGIRPCLAQLATTYELFL